VTDGAGTGPARSAEQAWHDAKRSPSPLAGPEGKPLHRLLTSVAIGAWVCSFVFDLFSQNANDPGVYSRGSYWLVAIGIGFGMAGATVGLLDLLPLPRGSEVWRTGVRHLVAADVAVVVFLISFLLRRELIFLETPWSLVALSVIGLAAVGWSAWTGLDLTYRWGVRVAEDERQLPGYELEPQAGAEDAKREDAAEAEDTEPEDGPVLDDAPADGDDVGVATHET
jgi:uncharacterized membrane protein